MNTTVMDRPTESATDLLVEANGVKKAFHGVPALRNGQLRLKRGTVHALCGGNGAGKSTFLNILMGLLPRDGGEIRVRGEDVAFANAAEALKSGVAIITQELSPVPEMTVAENLYLGREPRIAGMFVNFPRMIAEARALLARLRFNVPATAKMGNLSLAQIQLVEIAKALSTDADVIIMDEPTSAIGEHEVHILFEAIRRIKERGTGIIYVSHKLTEIFEIAEEYTVFRDGQFIESGRIADIDRRHLVTQIVGREVRTHSKTPPAPDSPVLLDIRNLSRTDHFDDVSLEVTVGEVVGIYGLLGSGRTEFLEAVYGLEKPTSGQVILDGQPVKQGNPKESIRRGMALVSEDRKQTGLVLTSSVAQNISLSALSLLAVSGFIKRREEARLVSEMVSLQRIKAASIDLPVENLSGGNQQKVVFARCLTTRPRVLICDEPTRGIDEGSKQEIYAFLRDFAAKGHAVLVVSSEAPEILQLSDRIAIFKDGRMMAIIDGTVATQQMLMDLSS